MSLTLAGGIVLDTSGEFYDTASGDVSCFCFDAVVMTVLLLFWKVKTEILALVRFVIVIILKTESRIVNL